MRLSAVPTGRLRWPGFRREHFIYRLLNLLAGRRLIQGIAPQTMSQRHCRNSLNVLVSYSTTPFERGQRACSTHDRELTTMAIDFKIRAELRDLFQYRSRNVDLAEIHASARNSFAQLLLIFCKLVAERLSISIVAFAALDNVIETNVTDLQTDVSNLQTDVGIIETNVTNLQMGQRDEHFGTYEVDLEVLEDRHAGDAVALDELVERARGARHVLGSWELAIWEVSL